MEQKKKQLIQQLLNYFEGDKTRVKRLGDGCKAIGFSLSEEKNIDAVIANPEAFTTIISYSDLGILGKLTDVLEVLKK